MIRPVFVFLLLGLAAVQPLRAQDAAAPADTNAVAAAEESQESEATINDLLAADGALPAEEAPKDNWDNVIKFFKDLGRTCGIGFAILSVLGLGCVLERLANLTRRRVVPNGFSRDVIDLWHQGKFDEIEDKCASSNSMLARVTETILEHRANGDYQEVKLFAEDKAGRELRLEARKSTLIAIVATVAPMLGLFGTVLGLRDAFGRVAAVGDMGNPAILADSINLALVTTVVGLALAMPALLIYNYFKNRLALYAVILEEEISDLVNNLFIKKQH